MADKMMRIAGRGIDGTAKSIRTDNNGNIITQIVRGERRQLVSTVSVPASSSVQYEVVLSNIISSSISEFKYINYELSWYSPDGMGRDGTEIELLFHRLSGNFSENSLTAKIKLNSENGIKEMLQSTFCIDNDFAQRIRDNFMTIVFINNTASNKGIYYPTLILK